MRPDVEEQVRSRLTEILDPCSVAAGNAMNIVEMGLVEDVALDGDRLHVRMRLTSPQCPMLQHFVVEVQRVVADLPAVGSVSVRGDRGMDWTPAHMSAAATERRRDHLLALVAR